MTDDPWSRDEIESPCVKICMVHPDSRLCIGCHRSLDEIRDWSKMTPKMRRQIMADLPARGPKVAGRRKGGRNGRLNR